MDEDSRCRIVLADDHTLFREGIKRIIEEAPGLEVVAEAADGLELLHILKTVPVDLVILDISMPRLRGIEATRELKKVHPDTRVLIVTMHKELEFLQNAIAAGADGFMVKEDSGSELLRAVEKVRGGGIYVSPCFSDEMTED